MTNKIWKLPKRETELWVEALRSGEYKQGKNSLYNSLTNTLLLFRSIL